MSDVTLDSTSIEIETVQRYFETFNAAEFEATAALFAIDAIMHAPFKTEVMGRDAIVTYLQTEAKGMQATPQTVIPQDEQVEVTGFARYAGFKVNIVWTFHLNPAQEITDIYIKLVASAQELLKMRR